MRHCISTVVTTKTDGKRVCGAGRSLSCHRKDTFRDKLDGKSYGETILFSEKVDLLSCWVIHPVQDTGLSIGARVSRPGYD